MDRLTESFLKCLEDQKILPRKELEKLMLKSEETKIPLASILQEKGVSKADILKAMADSMGGIEWVDLTSFVQEQELASLVPKSMAIRHGLLCIGKKGGKLVIAMSDPTDVFAVEYVTMRTGCEIIPMLAIEADLRDAIEKAYPKEEMAQKTSKEKGSVQPEKQIVGSGKEAVEEATLQEIGKGKFLTIDFKPADFKPAQQQASLKPLENLLTLTRELSATLEIDRLLIKILEAVQQLCSAEAGSVLLYDKALHVLYFKCASGKHGESLKRVVLPVTEESIAGWVALHREPLTVNDTSSDKRHYKGIDQLVGYKTRNLICVPILAGGKLYGVLEAVNKKSGTFTDDDASYLAFLASHSGVCLANASLVGELQDYFMHSVEILIAAVEALDPSFKGHMTKVARLSAAVAKDLGISGKTYESISYAALLHDIGKLKLTPLSNEEIEKQHPSLGVEMLKDVKLMKDIIPLIKMHHERFDGSGFPQGISGEAIPIGARILSLAEDFAEWEENSGGKSLEAFVQERGAGHDPRVLGSFQKVMQNFSKR